MFLSSVLGTSAAGVLIAFSLLYKKTYGLDLFEVSPLYNKFPCRNKKNIYALWFNILSGILLFVYVLTLTQD